MYQRKKEPKSSKADTKLQDVTLSYIFMSAFDKVQPKKSKNQKIKRYLKSWNKNKKNNKIQT